MAINPSKTVSLENLLQEFGKSLLEAQRQINQRSSTVEELQTGIAISEIEIDLKMLVDQDINGAALRPVGSEMAQLSGMNTAAFSSLRTKLIAVPEFENAAPIRQANEIRREVLSRSDLMRLEEIFGKLQVETTYISAKKIWLVDVKTPSGQLVRNLQISDNVEFTR